MCSRFFALGGSLLAWIFAATTPAANLFAQSSSGYINVKGFGAKGDGKTDDTKAIQAAFDAAASQRIQVRADEILDMPPLPINEIHAVVRVERPIKEFVELLIKAGVPHHVMTVRGDLRRELTQLASLMGIPVVTL